MIGDHAALLAFGKADPEVESERTSNLVGKERSDTLAADSSDHLADEPAVGSGVITVRGSRLPHRALRGECLDGWLPRQEFLNG